MAYGIVKDSSKPRGITYNSQGIYDSSKYYTPSTTQYAPNYFTDPNDPLALNSFADALFNRDAKEQRYGDWVNIPLVGDVASTVVGAADVLYNTSIKPILGNAQYGFDTNGVQGAIESLGAGFTQAGINTLVNLGETIDIVANPVKATAIEGLAALGVGDFGSQLGGDVLGGIASSVGLNGDGRRQYDWDTGNFVSDLALEIVSDPTNWITFGASGAAKAGADAAITAGLKSINVADDVAQQASKVLSDSISRGVLQQKDTIPNYFTRTFNLTEFKGVPALSNTVLENDLMKAGLTRAQAGQLGVQMLDDIAKGTLQGVSTLTSARRLKDFGNAIDDAILKTALYTSGTGQLIDITKAATKGVTSGISDMLKAYFKTKSPNASVPADDMLQYYVDEINAKPDRIINDALNELQNISTISDVNFKPNNYIDVATQTGESSRTKLLDIRNTYKALIDAGLADEGHKYYYDVAEKALEIANMPTDPVTKFLYQKLGPVFKTGYLSTGLGTPLRNAVDAISKNAINRGGMQYIPAAIKDYIDTDRLIKEYNETLEMMLDFMENHRLARTVDVKTGKIGRTVIDASEVKFNQELIKNFYLFAGELYKKVPALNERVFSEVHRLFNDSQSLVDGMYGDLANQLDNYKRLQQINHMLNKFEAIEPKLQEAYYELLKKVPPVQLMSSTQYNKTVSDLVQSLFKVNGPLKNVSTAFNKQFVQDSIKFVQLPAAQVKSSDDLVKLMRAAYEIKDTDNVLNFLMEHNVVSKAMNSVETRARVASYIESMRQSRTIGEAKMDIAATHYVYGNKTVTDKIIEAYFPFMTFTKNNAKHWDSMLFGRDYYNWASPIKKLFNSSTEDAYTIWNTLVDEVSQFAKFRFTSNQQNRKLYDSARKEFIKKYFTNPELAGKLTDTQLKELNRVGGNFFGFLRGFINSYSNPKSEEVFEVFLELLGANTKKSTSVKQFANMWTTAANLEDLTNPDVGNYEDRYRPDPFTLEEDYPELTIHPSEVFRILAGNVGYGDKIQDPDNPSQTLQRTVKLSPSFIDALNYISNPVGTTYGRLFSPIGAPIDLAVDLSDGELTRGIDRYIADVTPIAGTVYTRASTVPGNWDNFNSIDMLFPSVAGVNSTNTLFDPSNPTMEVTDAMVYRWYKQMETVGSNINPYETFPQAGNTVSISQNRYYQGYNNLYEPSSQSPNQNVNNLRSYNYSRPTNLYDRLYTKSGTFRLSLSGQYGLDGIQRLFRNNYYYY